MVETGLKVPPRDMFPVPFENIVLSKPTIAAVIGVAFAGGWMIAQACDLCVASSTAKFAITEVEVGRGSPWAARAKVMLTTEMVRATAIDAGYAAHEKAYNSDDAQQGPRAFAEKRKPEWKGR